MKPHPPSLSRAPRPRRQRLPRRPVGRLTATLGLMALLTACRADPGPADPDRLFMPGAFDADDVFREGATPFREGEARLSFGIFHEGPHSERIAIDGISTHYYIYEVSPGGPLTYRQIEDRDRVEGWHSDRLIHGGQAWWGGGLHFDIPRDLSAWGTLHLSLSSRAEAFAEVEIGMGSGSGTQSVKATDYGYVPDGAWHALAIPLSDFAALGVELGALTDALVLGGGKGRSGEALKVDDVYLSRD